MNLGTIKFHPPGHWVIECKPHVAMRAKRIFPRMSQTGGTFLTLQHTPEVANDLEWFLQRFPLEIDAASRVHLTRTASAHRAVLERLERIMAEPPVLNVTAMAIPPREYQRTAAALYLARNSLMLGDVIGLGKTVTGITTLTDIRTLPAVIAVKTHLPLQWQAELAKFLPGARVHIIKKMANYDLPPAEVYIITYSKLTAWWGILAEKCQSVIFDEIQELRVTGSDKYRAAKGLTSVVPFRLGLSATPIFNYGPEAWNLFNLLEPDALGSYEEFYREWCIIGPGGKHIVKDPDALGSYLRNQHLVLRRTRREVGRELPPVMRYVQEVELDYGIYDKVTSTADALANIILNGSFTQRGQAARQLDLELRQATGLAKAPYVADLVRMLLESGEKVLLGGWHHSVYDVWLDRLKDFNPVCFTGRETAAQKEASKQAFLTGKSNLLIMNLRSGDGTDGLQNVASVVVIGELDWVPQVHEQFIGRLARDGQDESVQAFIPVATEGSDPTMAAICGLKESQAVGIMDLGVAVNPGQVEVDSARMVQLAKDYLSRRKPAAANS